MARYHYTRENKNGVVLYLESEPAEDAMDEFDDEIAVGFSGNGYLSFWTRCRKAAEALPNGLKYAAGGRCVITDTFTGEEKIWRVPFLLCIICRMYGVSRSYRVFLLAGMPACYICRQQEGRHRSRPWQEGV